MMSNENDTHKRRGAEFFLRPATARQRQYEALRAYLVDGLSAQEVTARFARSPAAASAATSRRCS